MVVCPKLSINGLPAGHANIKDVNLAKCTFLIYGSHQLTSTVCHADLSRIPLWQDELSHCRKAACIRDAEVEGESDAEAKTFGQDRRRTMRYSQR